MERQYYFDEDLGRYEEILPKYYHHNLTDRELIQTFFSSSQEAQKLFSEKIKEWQEVKEKILQTEVKPALKEIREIKDEFGRWFWREALKVLVDERLIEAINHIQRLKRLKLIASDKPEGKIKNFEAEVGLARQTPILNIAFSFLQLKKSGRNYTALCPFHPEKHPSFYIYPETNSFYCYGCNQGGDVVKFVQLALNYDFKEAVAYLTRR
ncbi:MAG: CHC2 zinc finger domain-containing protein [Candidatus Omnitrophica bacterium]|nr:CHC2 zinc finger domain-containing protein [Candidatus Omnitrophota bacterium]